MPLLHKLKNYFITLFLVAITAHCIINSTKYIKGDGNEYLLTSYSFINHHSPEARQSDVDSTLNVMMKYAKHNASAILVYSRYNLMFQDSLDSSIGYNKSLHEKYYALHFWLYPLMNVPALYLTNLFHISPIHSFLITNIIIFVLTLTFLIKTKILSSHQRYFITAFYLLCGTTYYLDWSHPEVMTASFCLIGLILLLDHSLLLSALFLALAAQQNPPIGLIAAGVLILKFALIFKDMIQQKMSLTAGIKKSLAPFFIGLVLITAPIFYYLNFGTPNIIMKFGWTDHQLISLDRLYSLFFNLNQGMIIAMPALFAVLGIGLFYNFTRSRPGRPRVMALLMIVISILMAIPSLSATNWNCGQSIFFLRYAYWISMPLGIATMLLISQLPAKTFKIIFTLFFLVQCMVVLHFKISGKNDSTKYKKTAEYLLAQHPSWYNPLPVILVVRGLNGHILNEEETYFYVNTDSVSKVLYHDHQKNRALSFCQQKTPHDIAKVVKPVKTENGWFYLNLPAGFCPTNQNPGLHII